MDLIVAANDVLLSPTLTHAVVTHPGNLAFSILCQSYASKFPPNGVQVNVHPAAIAIAAETRERGGRVIRLKDQSLVPVAVLSDDEIIDRIVSILATIRSVSRVEDAMQMSVPEIMFALNKSMPLVANPTEPASFPLSFWFREEYDNELERDYIVVIAPPELPHGDDQMEKAGALQPLTPRLPTSSDPELTSLRASSKSPPRITGELIEDSMPDNASSVFHLFDRRVNFDHHAADASIYSLLRSWVQDDPHRMIPTPGVDMSCYDSVTLESPTNDDVDDDATACCRHVPRRRKDVLGTLAEDPTAVPSTDTIRIGFVNYAKLIRKHATNRMKRRHAEAEDSLRRRGINL
ncbi:hypothetical protein MPSEU_000489000 [Mayamaea pseudoterrestris]|nr:hypothetical protein MPSEU_000489000 [Mayamaea pseudoterrestris]